MFPVSFFSFVRKMLVITQRVYPITWRRLSVWDTHVTEQSQGIFVSHQRKTFLIAQRKLSKTSAQKLCLLLPIMTQC